MNQMAVEGPRIYNLFPLLAGPIAQWPEHLPRIARMGFNWLYVNPFHNPGFSGSLYAVKDYYSLNPILRGPSRKSADRLVQDFVTAAGAHGLAVMMDLVVNHTAKDSLLAEAHPAWFAREPDGALRSPRAIDPDDARQVTVWGDLAEIDYADRPARADIVAYWCDLVRHYVGLGFRGFRCDAAYQVPAEVWRQIIAAARAVQPDIVVAAETLGCRPEEVERLRPAGFDYLFNSAKWWDFRADWLLQQYQAFRHIAPSIAFPESHDTERLVAELARTGVTESAAVEAAYRQRYLFAALFSTGVMMPMGYEFGFAGKLDVARTRPEDWEAPRFDLTGFIAEVNRLKASLPALNQEGPQRRLPLGSGSHVVALCRDSDDGTDRVLSLINPDLGRAHEVPAAALHVLQGSEGGAEELTPGASIGTYRLGGSVTVPPGAIRVFDKRQKRGQAMIATAPSIAEVPAADLPAAVRSQPIVIEDVYPELDDGRFPVKREVGDLMEVWATIFKEGHDKIAAVVQYRRRGEDSWREVPMTLENPGLDRWRGSFRLDENARYEYTIAAWHDGFESRRDEIDKKRGAGQDVSLELIEGRDIVAGALGRASPPDAERLRKILADFDAAADAEDRAAYLLSSMVRAIMARSPDRGTAARYDRTLEVTVDRVRARFAAWYEMFPRSQGTTPGKGATFKDCERRLAELRDMGFDVVYFVPIHPIGRIHRKGKNNAVVAEPGEPGSPYAIGAAEGGHTAVHPDLGTLDDFRRLVAAAHEHGMDVALDFAIQCSPDHPWIEEHPEWFKFRPDGTIKYAENPPKKYQDIVNVDFHGRQREALWRELRDVVLFWAEQGVKTFRVDNPHTKPVPFWEWLIGEVNDRHPDAIFLSEAFTRPPMLKMLAKVGFSQSYTYFTWRNFKQELIDYLTELTQTEVKEYLRPNFFTNTPDINPPYLQTGGRPAHQVRLVLAATLSSVYGIYNGFELCEATPIPGKEEYLNSEKYEYKVWDWDRPGNIKDTIAAVNRIRRENPALQELDNLRFYPAHDDNILFYGKMTPDRSNMVFVAVNLDPFEPHAADVEFPLSDMGIPEPETYEVEELLSGAKHLWRGGRQHVRLDPAENPAAILRIVPWQHVDYREPCF
jgi:starch synthase (maltosyl-transferring)